MPGHPIRSPVCTDSQLMIAAQHTEIIVYTVQRRLARTARSTEAESAGDTQEKLVIFIAERFDAKRRKREELPIGFFCRKAVM